ncbi:hypothetical protein [Synechococcus sp. MU1648]|uniref:hypothetical protein n=1 Tax=Synechococcus sp. MU1648 TaxID=2508351 RepID=UPI002026C784|nr:hypothetical protein [Synechococcus sp. MU1648]
MFLVPFFTRFRTSLFKATTKPEIITKKNSQAAKKIIENFRLQVTKNSEPTNNTNKALEDINKTIQSDGATNQLLLKKSEILLSKGKIRQARQILQDVSQNKRDQKATTEAKKLLEISLLLQQEANENKFKKLVNDLHEIAHRYEKKLPLPEELLNDQDITPIVREEARLARSAELPKLSYELIDQILQSGQESPWLLQDKALSLSMMGQKSAALDMLRSLKKIAKGSKLTTSINKSIEYIKENSKYHQSKSKLYLAKQTQLIARTNDLDLEFIDDPSKIDNRNHIKFLIFRKARSVLEDKPKASLYLVNSILDYFQDDLAALQLKGEALAALRRSEEAIQIWENLAHSKDENIANKACELISQTLSLKAKQISANKPPKEALFFFIEEHLKLNLAPTVNDEVEKILTQLEPSNPDSSDPELQQHRIQLLFNTLVIECFETQWRDRGRLDASATAQKPGTISKTALEAG